MTPANKSNRKARWGGQDAQVRQAVRKSPVTIALAVFLSIAFFIQLRTVGFDSDIAVLLGAGATTGWMVQAGEIFRLATASFLHLGVLHFQLNVMGIVLVGLMLEPRWGSLRTLLVVLGGGMAGMLATSSGFSGDIPTVGSSVFAYALLGGANGLIPVSRAPRSWLRPAGVLLLVGSIEIVSNIWIFSSANISTEAHLGALAGGLTMAILVHPESGILRGSRLRRAALGAAGAELALLGWGTVALLDWDDRAMFRGAPILYARNNPNADIVASLAWHAQHSPLATDRDLREARAALQRVLATEPQSAYAYRTEAHLLLQHDGRTDVAVERFHEAFARDPIRDTALDLAQLEAESHGSLPGTPAVSARENPDGTWGLRVGRELGRGCEWHLLGLEDGVPRGYVRLVLGEAARKDISLGVAENETLEGVQWHVARERCNAIAAEAREAIYWAIDLPAAAPDTAGEENGLHSALGHSPRTGPGSGV